MKAVLIALFIASAAMALHLPNFLHAHREDPVAQQFEAWMKKHQKFYGTQEEFSHRFNVYKENLKLIKWIQANDDSAVYGPTQFADLTSDEFSKQYLTLKVPYIPKDEERTSFPVNVGDLPEEWDWRKYNAVTPVKNQGGCGSCWAFSAAGNLEGQNAIKHTKLLNVSTQQLVDCDDIDSGCNGGYMEWAFQFINKTGGIMTNEDYPYKGIEGQCHFDKSKVAIKVLNQTFMTKNETEIAAALVNIGPLAVALDATFLQFYIFGIFDPVWCGRSLNHGVLHVGYGEAKKPFWIIKNSWGPGWGESGYFRMVRGKGKCAIDDYTITAVIA